jgi:hypothetical protein
MFPGWRGGCAPEFPDRGVDCEIPQRAWSSQLGFGFLLYQKNLLSRVISSIFRQQLGTISIMAWSNRCLPESLEAERGL